MRWDSKVMAIWLLEKCSSNRDLIVRELEVQGVKEKSDKMKNKSIVWGDAMKW